MPARCKFVSKRHSETALPCRRKRKSEFDCKLLRIHMRMRIEIQMKMTMVKANIIQSNPIQHKLEVRHLARGEGMGMAGQAQPQHRNSAMGKGGLGCGGPRRGPMRKEKNTRKTKKEHQRKKRQKKKGQQTGSEKTRTTNGLARCRYKTRKTSTKTTATRGDEGRQQGNENNGLEQPGGGGRDNKSA